MFLNCAKDIMKKYYQNDPSQVNHSLRVLETAEMIYTEERLKEGFLYDVLRLASIFHDIGIPQSRIKYNSSAPKYQEIEGPPVARKLMTEIGIRPDVLERVCFIVGNHHTYKKIDGIDFQILFEADMVVNLQEGWGGLDREELKARLESGAFTSTGKTLILKYI
jgi:HD superfamily phosphodiesterase